MSVVVENEFTKDSNQSYDYNLFVDNIHLLVNRLETDKNISFVDWSTVELLTERLESGFTRFKAAVDCSILEDYPIEEEPEISNLFAKDEFFDTLDTIRKEIEEDKAKHFVAGKFVSCGKPHCVRCKIEQHKGSRAVRVKTAFKFLLSALFGRTK